MLAAVALLVLLNLGVWALDLLMPYPRPDAGAKRGGLLFLLYVPLWALVSNAVAVLFLVTSHRPLLGHGRSPAQFIWVGLFLGAVFALLHRPLLSLAGRYLLGDRRGLWAPTSALVGAIAGLLQYLIVRAHVRVGLVALVVFCVASCVVGYSVGYVRSLGPRQRPA